MSPDVGFFTYLWNVVFSFFGHLCGQIYSLCTLTTSELARLLMSPDTTHISDFFNQPFNFFTGESIHINLASVTNLLYAWVSSSANSLANSTNIVDTIVGIFQVVVSGLVTESQK